MSLEVDNTFLCHLDSDYFKISSINWRPCFLVTLELAISGDIWYYVIVWCYLMVVMVKSVVAEELGGIPI